MRLAGLLRDPAGPMHRTSGNFFYKTADVNLIPMYAFCRPVPFILAVRGLLPETQLSSYRSREPRPAGRGKLLTVSFYCSRELRVAPSRELLDADTGTRAVVLASARTVKGVTGSSRSRSNSNRIVVRGLPTENSRPLVLNLAQIVLIVPPTADTLRTVKSSRSRSNGKECNEEFALLLYGP